MTKLRTLTTTAIGLLAGALLSFAGLAAEARPAGKVAILTAQAWTVTPGATYAWAPSMTDADPRVANDIVQARMRAAVDSALAAKGLIRVDNPAAATLMVSYRVGVEDKVETHVDSFGRPATVCGFRGCFVARGYGATMVDVDRFVEGTLVLDLTHRESGRLVWRAASRKHVTRRDAGQARLNAVLAAMTRSLPGA